MCTTPNAWPGCWKPPDTSAPPTEPTPTSSSSTPARCGRTPTTSCMATSAIWRRASRPTPTCRSPSAAAWRRRTATPSCRRPRGWTWCSAPTTSGHCRLCSTALATIAQLRSKSPRRWRNSRPRCPRRANPHTPHGFRSPSAATTPARSASCPRCAARRSTAGPATCWPKCSRWSTRACWRSRCWARTSTHTGCRSPIPISPVIAAHSPSCCARAGASTGSSGCGSPHRIPPSSPTM